MSRTVDLQQQDLAATSKVRSTTRVGGITDRWIAADHDLLRVRSQMTSFEGIAFVHGASVAQRDLLLHVVDESPALALHITMRGTASPRVNGDEGYIRQQPGQWLVFTGQAAHDVEMDRGVSNAVLRINFTRAHLEELARHYPALFEGDIGRALAGGRPTVRQCLPLPMGTLLNLVEELHRSQCRGSLRRLFLESTAHQMLVRALMGSSREPETRPGPRERERMLEARAHLLDHMHAPPTLAALARVVGTNEFRLKRDFKAAFGEPVHAFLLARRLEHARDLLLDGQLTIKQIANEIGYAHVAHFSTMFHKRFGVAPSALRRKRESRP